MVSRKRQRKIIATVGLYLLAGLCIGYFWINAYSGDYGLKAQEDLDQQVSVLETELSGLRAERSMWERRTALLRTDRLDPDMLDERARRQLNFLHPMDVTLAVPPR